MEADLIARLLADSSMAALVGNRINPVSRIQSDGLPALTLMRVSPGRAYTFAGADGTHGTLIQFDCWAKDNDQMGARGYASVKAIMAALTHLLETPASAGTTDFRMSFLQSERDSQEDVSGIGTVFRISADFIIWWKPVS